MRTYTHAVLSYLAAVRLSDERDAVWASVGAALPDLPALAGSGWLILRDRRFSRNVFYGEVCGRRRFGLPDAALHSAVPLAASVAVIGAWGASGRPTRHGKAFLLGWTGHVASDLLTHGSDARSPLWPVSRWRFESPISYRERDRHGPAFTMAEHAALVLLLYRTYRTFSQRR